MDLNRVLGALLGGAAQPPRRRRRNATPSLLGGRGGNAALARALGTVAGAAIEAMMRGGQAATPAPAPAPAPAPRPAGRPWGGDIRPVSTPAPSPRTPQAGGSPWSRPAAPPPEPEAPAAEEAESLLLMRAMIAAAKADGAVDAAERKAIAAQLDAAGLSAEERDFVLADFDRPMTPESLAAEATDPMLRARLYAAAFAGAGEVTEAERAWLDRLARALKLDKAAAAAIEERLSA
ncbi:DUF533 domain-containing protein [Falsiroseomonas sp. CW058]|uniref:DUF533 domain-containing protein n=1 Tax=Falsiroseomonas sp. CW058 TaxID=3388664 RepID=UPI003D30FD27